MSHRLDPTNLCAISRFGEMRVAEATQLTEATLRLASAAASNGSAGRLGYVLAGLTALDVEVDRSERVEASSLLSGSQTLVDQLARLKACIDPLDRALQDDLTELARAAAAALNAGIADNLQAAQCASLIELRKTHLRAARAGLARCQALLAQRLSAERNVEDQFVLVRDVTAPIAYRNAGLTTLSQQAEGARPVAGMVDQACVKMIQSDLNALHRTPVASPRTRGLEALATRMLNAMVRSV